MARKGKTVPASRAEAKIFLAKAEQFLEEARTARDAGRHDAAMLNAIHAAISATDGVTAALGGRRSADPDHRRSADLLEEVAAGSDEVGSKARQLKMLLARKNVVEYESRRVTAREARESVERADRLVEWSRDVIRRAQR